MKCPKCMATLALVEIGAIELDRCGACQGLWFDAGELERLLENPGEFGKSASDGDIFEKKDFPDDYGRLDDRHGDCPKCCAKMFRMRFDGVKADTCPGGHGIWFDGGEIFLLLGEKEKTFFELIKYILSKESFKKLLKSLKSKGIEKKGGHGK